MKTPERTTAEVFPRYLGGEVLADSATLKWPGLFVRRYRFPRTRGLPPFTLMSCDNIQPGIACGGSSELRGIPCTTLDLP